MTIWRWSARGIWLWPLTFVISLVGTELLGWESLRPGAVLILALAGLLVVLGWQPEQWHAALPAGSYPKLKRTRLSLLLLAGAILTSASSHIAFLNAPRATFGVAGLLWLAGICFVTTAAALGSIVDPPSNNREADARLGWTRWELVLVGFIALVALVLRVWDLRDVPFNIYPDEIITGSVAEHAYLNGSTPAPLFSTLWGDIELPALWFAIVAAILKVGGITLASVRLPAALFGAATVVPFYGFLRNAWGRVVAISGASLMAFSAVDVHYSRMALNNITTPFFWTICFLFLVRGLRTRRPLDWTLAGIAGGVSEHFYYGTRLLPFILGAFILYLVVVHWRKPSLYGGPIGWLGLGYLIGFGPLLSYFLTHPGLYYGRGAGLMTWNHVPTNWPDWQKMWRTLSPIVSENLLGISTHTCQDIMYYAPLLLKPEAALFVLGAALLLWQWRNPAAFLMLLAGVGVLFVGGTLVLYRNSSPPMLAHWTPAFPVFFAAIALPIGASVHSLDGWLRQGYRWLTSAVLVIVLCLLGYANIEFYFYRYYADPASLRSKHYKSSQIAYEEQTVQSRYMASLGPGYRVIVVGRSPYPYDADTTRYLVQEQEYIAASDPQGNEFSLAAGRRKNLAFLFFKGNEQYEALIRERSPGGVDEEVRNPVGQDLFHAYVLKRD